MGEPLCKKIPDAAKQINEFATKNLVNICKNKKVKRFIFASTCSNYGSSQNVVNELSPVMPLSLYSECKVNSEKFILDQNNDIFETCVLRFATAHGLSPRMRFDLLVQEFMRDAIVDKKISIFGADFWRPLVHVEDMADACISAIDASSQLISGQIYNVGNDKENYTKIKLAEIIKEFITDVEIEILNEEVNLALPAGSLRTRKDIRSVAALLGIKEDELNNFLTKKVEGENFDTQNSFCLSNNNINLVLSIAPAVIR